jgi:hypothetical protein
VLSEPIGLDALQAIFSWKIYGGSEGARQTAHRIRRCVAYILDSNPKL